MPPRLPTVSNPSITQNIRISGSGGADAFASLMESVSRSADEITALAEAQQEVNDRRTMANERLEISRLAEELAMEFPDPDAYANAITGAMQERLGAAPAHLRADVELLARDRFQQTELRLRRDAYQSSLREADAADRLAMDNILREAQTYLANEGPGAFEDERMDAFRVSMQQHAMNRIENGAVDIPEEYLASTMDGFETALQVSLVRMGADTVFQQTGSYERALEYAEQQLLQESMTDDERASALADIMRPISQEATRRRSYATAETASLRRLLRDNDSVRESGLEPEIPYSEIARRASALGTPEAMAIALEAAEGASLQRISEEFARMSLPAAEAMLRATRAELENAEGGVTGAQVRAYESMERQFSAMQNRLGNDALGYASEVGEDIGALDFSSPGALATTLAEREPMAISVATHFGVERQYFSQAEIDGINSAIESGGISRSEVAAGVIAGLGQNAQAALEQLAPNDEMLVHLGGLQIDGAPNTVQRIEAGLELMAAEGAVSRHGSVEPRLNTQRLALGELMQTHSAMSSRIIAAADAMYELDAFRRGDTRDDFEANARDGIVRADNPYTRNLIEASGGVFIEGVQYGGLTRYRSPRGGNNSRVIAPSWLRADRMGEVVTMIANGDIQAGPMMVDIPVPYDRNGEPMDMRTLTASSLRFVDNGLYAVITHPRAGFHAVNEDGSNYLLDLNQYEANVRALRPEWTRSR